MIAGLSPYAQAAASLSTLGYTVIPLIDPAFTQHQGRGKAPGEFRSGSWQGMSKWQRFRDVGPSSFDITRWSNMPAANAGLVMGTSVGRDLHVIALDFDAEDPDALDTLLRAAPASPMVKRGMKGETRLYLASKDMKTASFDDTREVDADGKVIAKRLLDRLAGFDTRQTVVPPSVHPDTGQPYVWTRGPVPATELPVLTAEDMAALEEALEQCGWERGGRTKANGRERTVRSPDEPVPDDAFSEAKAAAMANLSAWVPHLGLYGLRPARGGYECVESWRASSTGRPLSERKRNLSIQPDGIKDWGSNNTYSSIDLVMAARECSQAEALTWLEERLGLGDDGSVVIALGGSMGIPTDPDDDLPEPLRKLPTRKAPTNDLSGERAGDASSVLAAATGSVPVSVSAPTLGIGREVPEHLTRVPGLVGLIADWITATARKPQPVLSLAAALGIVGTAAGRKFAGPTDSATHLYFLCTAGTGAGKNAPKKAANALLAAAGLRSLQGPGSFMSASALIQHVSQQPASLCIMDEFGVFLSKLNGRNNSSHERGISGEMRQFWSLCFEEYRPPKWAHSASRQDVAPIISPALSIVGLSTPDEFYAALQGADVVSGFANRFLVMATDRNPEDVEPSASVFDVPSALIQGLQDIAGTGGALASATMHSAQADRPLVRVPWAGGTGSDAQQVFRELKAEVAARTDNEALLQRTAEMAVRLATVRAIGIAGARAQVSREDMRWGAELAMWSANRMIADVDAHMVESDHQARAKLVLRIISATPGPMSRTALCRKVNHRFDARTLDSVISGLIDAGQVEAVTQVSSNRTSTGRPPKAYRALI